MKTSQSTITVAATALNQTPLDWEGNRERIINAIVAARSEGVKILALPELAISGYGCEDLFFSPWVAERAAESLAIIIKKTRGIAVAVGLPIRDGANLYNGVAVISDRKLLGIGLKQNLDGGGVYYEPRWFTPWRAGETRKIRIGALGKVLCGELVFDLAGVRLGLEICQDAWVKDRVANHFKKDQVDLIINCSASYFEFEKTIERAKLCHGGAKHARIGYIYSNSLGCESGRLIFDGDCSITTSAGARFESQLLSFSEYSTIKAVLPWPGVPRKRAAGLTIIRSKLDPTADHTQFVKELRRSKPNKAEEFARAVALGLFDYLRRSRAHGAVLSLSGGIDSSAVAILFATAIRLAFRELGVNEFCRRLGHIPGLATITSENEAVSKLLSCVYQGTKNNSPASLVAARAISRELGAQFQAVKIDSAVNQYEKLMQPVIGRAVNWQEDDIAKQNIQARVRAPGIWLVANVKKALLLTTSNRSEIAVGYSTMDGDTCGSIAPIAGVDKLYLREWLQKVAGGQVQTVGKIAAAKLVFAQPPGPELRPRSRKQRGEEDLMPFAVLDHCERLFLEQRLSPDRCIAALKQKFANEHTSSEITKWGGRFFALWSTNQWKRERLAPSFHLDHHNLDPKTWCRFPILSAPLF